MNGNAGNVIRKVLLRKMLLRTACGMQYYNILEKGILFEMKHMINQIRIL